MFAVLVSIGGWPTAIQWRTTQLARTRFRTAFGGYGIKLEHRYLQTTFVFVLSTCSVFDQCANSILVVVRIYFISMCVSDIFFIVFYITLLKLFR